MVWALGIIATDGHIKLTKTSKRVQIGMQDKDVLEKLNTLLESNIPIRKIHFKGGYNGKGWYYYLDIPRVKVVQDLIKLGIPPNNKSLSLTFPHIPSIYIKDFIRGCIEGDGTISRDKYQSMRLAYIGGSYMFISKLKEIIELMGYKTSLYTFQNSKNPVYRLCIRNARQFLNWLYDCPTNITMDRKRIIAIGGV